MATRNISLLGATYNGVPAVQLPISGGGTATFTEVTDTTATAADVASGKYFYTAAGVKTEGTNSGGGGESKNVQVVQGTARTSSATMSNIGADLLVSKAGTYDVYWSGVRTNTGTSYTYATQLYIDGEAYGSENSVWGNNVQTNHLSNVSLERGQHLRVRGRNSRNNSYYIYAPMLAIVES